MNKQKIQMMIDELEEALEQSEYGGYEYDTLNAELQFVYSELKRIES